MTSRLQAAFGPGFFGKLPSYGDYLARALPASFLTPWEEWLQDVWQSGWDRFGNVWPPLVAEGPVWRFALEADVCGPDPVAGLLMPSADRLGRVFPLCLVTALSVRTDPAILPVIAGPWYNRAEALLRQSLTSDLELDAFARQVSELGVLERPTPTPTLACPGPGWHVTLDPNQPPALSYPALVHELAATLPQHYSLWWTRGAARVAPSLTVCDGLPDSQAVTAFFDGAWAYWGWSDADAVYPEDQEAPLP
jgi:type VI secretion system protein ImpM